MEKYKLQNISSGEERGKRIKYLRTRLLGLTREELSKGSNFSLHSLKAWELCWGGGLTESGAEKISGHMRKLGIYCSVFWLLYGIGRPPNKINHDFNICEEEEAHIAKELLVFRELENSIDTIVKDDCMLPFFYPDTFVGGIITKNIDDAIAKQCIVVDMDENVYVRILNYGDNSEVYNLLCANEQTLLSKKVIQNLKIQLAAPIIWVRKSRIKP